MSNDKKVKYVKIDEDYERESPRPKATFKKKAALSPQKTIALIIGKTVGIIGTTIAAMVLVIIIALCITVTGLALYVTQFAESDFDVNLDDAELSSSTFIYAYDKDGSEVQLKQLSSDENRVLITLDELPQHVIDAFVSVEDNRFFEHDGVDWKRTVAVMVKSIFSDGSQGGSTITQQLVRDITGDKEITYGRKLREIFRALEMEKKYSKKDILESYLNRIPLGGTSYGIASASIRYFDKTPDKLTIAEAALLAGIVRSPGNNPYANPEYSRDKELYGLDCLLRYGYITNKQYNDAVKEQIRFKLPIQGNYFGYYDERYNEYYGIQGDDDDDDLYFENSSWEELGVDTDNSYTPYKWNGTYEVSQNWYVDAAIEQIIGDLAELKGVTKEAARTLFYKGGFKAYLNMDMEMQDKLEELFRDPYICLSWYDDTSVIDLPETPENEIELRRSSLIQGSFIVTNYSGSVLALAGGIGEKEGNGCFNRATQDPQIIGSTIKPLAVYSPAVENNIITYSTLIKDQSGKIPAGALGSETTFGYDPEDDTVRWPHNYQHDNDFGTEQYYFAWYAVRKSTNTIAVNTLYKVGLQNAFTQLSEKLHIALDPVNDMAYSPLALGSITGGVTLVDLAAAYAIMGNGGLYYHPYLYSKVVDSEGRIVLSQNVTGERVISSDTSYIVNRMMRQVVLDDGGSGRFAQLPDIEVVGKTGTANDESTLSFVGLTPNYVACFRNSRDNHKPIKGSDGWKTTASVWHDVMVELTAGEPAQSFAMDSNVKALKYCTETGLIAGSKCESTQIGYYRTSYIPPVCDGDHDAYWAEREASGVDEITLYD